MFKIRIYEYVDKDYAYGPNSLDLIWIRIPGKYRSHEIHGGWIYFNNNGTNHALVMDADQVFMLRYVDEEV